MQYAYLPFAAFLAAILVIVPVPWHWRARNIPTLSIMGWLFCMNVIYGVNVIVWNGNLDDRIPIWCDITNKLRIGAQTAIPASIFCVCRSLESIAANRVVYIDRATKRRWMYFDIAMCFGVPAIFMALHYVVQGHRYDILETFGCQPYTYISVAGIMIVWFPSLLFAFLAMVLAAAAFYHFFRHRLAFASHLQNANSALTTRRYFRLMGMSLVVILWNTALSAYNVAVNAQQGMRPWISWENVHSDWLRVDKYALVLLSTPFVRSIMVYWWAIPVSSFIVFFFFGLGEEATKEYRRYWRWFRRTILRREDRPSFTASLPSVAPRYPSKHTTTSSDSDKYAVTSPSTSLPSYTSSSTLALPAKGPLASHVMRDLPSLPHIPITPTTPSDSSDTFSLASVAEVQTPRTPIRAPSSAFPQFPRPFSFPSPYASSPHLTDDETRRFSFISLYHKSESP